MRAIVFSSHDYERQFLESAADHRHNLVFCAEKLDMDTVELARGAEAVVLFTSDRASAEVLEKLHKLGVQYICLRSVGHDHVDLDKAHKLGIKIANVPEYSPYAIAEHAVALLLALNRKIVTGQKLMDIGDFRLERLIGFDLHGKTVGIIGTGKIGSAFAHIMSGFGCRLLGFDPFPAANLVAKGLQYVSISQLFKQSDIISLHCPLNKETTYLLDTEAFSMMKKGVTLLNTSRGKVIESEALIRALDEGKVALAGLDVYEKEDTFFFKSLNGKRNTDLVFERLRSYPNVLITGHQAFLTIEALEGIARITNSNLDAFCENRPCMNEL